MKANELQIGDYVNYRGQIIKVTSLYDKGGSNEVGWSDKESVWVNADNVEPIPVTYEIIEKNRMRVFEHRNPWQEEAKNLIKKWYSKDGKFYVSHYRVGDMFTYTVGNGVSRICNIRYVHELQHALRLCGIEKEIEL